MSMINLSLPIFAKYHLREGSAKNREAREGSEECMKILSQDYCHFDQIFFEVAQKQ